MSESEKIVQKFYQVLNNNLETLTVKNTLKDAKNFLKTNAIEGNIFKPEFVIEKDQKNIILYGVTQKLVYSELNQIDNDWLWSNEKEARKFYQLKMLEFKKELESFESSNGQQYHETENEIRTDSSYLTFSHYQIDL